MLGLDVEASPQQYRTWIVDDSPDFTQERFTGDKSGDLPLVDVSAYIIYDGSVIANFNMPLPTSWQSTKRTLPKSVPASHLAIIDGYVYLFGGQITDKIYRASVNTPTEWIDTGSVLPTPLFDGSLAVINDRIYIFGGHNGEVPTKTIFSAPKSDPLTWTNHGSLLPKELYGSQLGIIDGNIYLFGGHNLSRATKIIYKAFASDPLTWQDTGSELPDGVYHSHLAIIDNYIYLFGGQFSVTVCTDTIYRASTTDPLNWVSYSFLPYAISSGQFFIVGSQGFLITPISIGRSPIHESITINNGATRILRCELSSPGQWLNTNQKVPGEISQSQLAIIYDRLFLFGGSGNSAIFANNYEVKYKFDNAMVVAYADLTRTRVNNTPNKLDLFRILGMAPWRTDFGT